MSGTPQSRLRQIVRPFYGLLGIVTAMVALVATVWFVSNSQEEKLRDEFEQFHMPVALSTLEAANNVTNLEQGLRTRDRLPRDESVHLEQRAVNREIRRRQLSLRRAIASIVDLHRAWEQSAKPFSKTVERIERQHQDLERLILADSPNIVDVETRAGALKFSLDQLDRLHSVVSVELVDRANMTGQRTRQRLVLVVGVGLLVAGFLGLRIVLRVRVRIREHEQTELLLEEREEQLRQASKMEALGSLAGGVAHDFNNLLTAILGYTEVAQHAMESPEPRKRALKALKEVQRAGERATGLTRQLLAFSRREAVVRRPIDVELLIRDLEPMLRRLIRADIRLEVRLAATDRIVEVDPVQIEQALINLAANAKDAMQDRGVLTVETANVQVTEADHSSSTMNPGDYVRIVVSDTGCGMTQETLSRAFDPFFTTKEPGKGTGLGLSSVHGIITKNEGHVTIRSDVGTGTRFEIYLPCSDEPAVRQSAPSKRPAVRGQEQVLVAEDDPQVRRLLVSGLQGAHYSILEAGDGEEALRLFTEHRETVQLVVTDVVMPKMRGPEWIDRARSMDPGVRVIYVSGYAEDEVLTDRAAWGTVLTKPFKLETLLATVQRELNAKRSETGAPTLG